MNCTASAIDPHDEMAMLILSEVLRFRRSVRPQANCAANCPLCQAPHIPKVLQAVRAQQPVSFVLPAFPGKSPNPAKVLGPLPDKAEQLALQFLQRLCDRIRRHYEPGAKILICSDGRVFSDVVGIRESDITNYQMELDQMIEQLGLRIFRLSTSATFIKIWIL